MTQFIKDLNEFNIIKWFNIYRTGLDAARINQYMHKSTQFRRGIAKYTQAIHSSIYGNPDQIGDVDIYVKYKSESFLASVDKHSLGFLMHILISTKKLILIGEQNGNGSIIEYNGQPLRQLQENECLIGEYDTFDESKIGKQYKISFDYKTEIFWNKLKKFDLKNLFAV